ncbi:hypothetical protein HNP38_001872 [Chryseobacterium defluvii]|uniref:Heme-binding HmuY-like protein n=1 Tax=Chryseobacterium defluvii TaxID=160396 RepID=A0A840KBK2_9FLAO|nr:hypothetical protein [Chryseobacterium defluvii]MBB4806576.1 hypothetical protein [Chryseobacterium defluvii]
MKKILFLLIGCLMFFACREAEADNYEGDSMLNFNKGVAGNGFVLNSQTYSDYKISYGSIKAVEGSHQVKLVFDATQSTAVLGTDFDILDDTDDLGAGETGGEFTIRIYKAPATQDGKTATFKLQSGSLPNAGFDQTYKLNMSLTCPIANFVGIFDNTETWWYNAPGGQFEIKENPSVANQLIIDDFFDVGYDLILNYNPTTFAVSVPEGQETGYIHPSYGMIKVKSSTDGALVSSFNPCTRKLTVYMNYYVPAGTFGNQKEVFQGI